MKNPPALYLEADTVSPDWFAGKTATQIAELTVFEGNTQKKLGDYFEINGKAGATAAETKIVVKGDVEKGKVHRHEDERRGTCRRGQYRPVCRCLDVRRHNACKG